MKSPLRILIAMLTFVGMTNAEEVKLLTYNVLADDEHFKLRVPELLDLIEKSDADIIALQEVAPWFLLEFLKQDWSKKYHLPTKDKTLLSPRGLLILSKQPITEAKWEFIGGRQGRAYLTIQTKLLDQPFTIATSHLESFLESGQTRAEQMGIIFTQINKHKNAIFLGDFNFGDGEAEEKSIPKTFKDAWMVTNPNESGFTWNIELSPMAVQGSFPNEKSRRLDRVLIKSKFFIPTKSMIIGDKPITGSQIIFPSDHFGLISSLKKISTN
jgi:endonuclease/exonuclease/phosphatase family metal-dependent hydrolase